MGKFNRWLDENHIEMKAYDKHDQNRLVGSARAKSADEVKNHLIAMHAHVQHTGRTVHVSIYNKRTFEHETHTIKVNNPTGHRKYDS